MTPCKLPLRLAPWFLLAALMSCSSGKDEEGNYKIAIVPSRAGQHGIFVMNWNTTGSRLLTPEPTAQLRVNSWSPDGSKIAFFMSGAADAAMLSEYRLREHLPLYVMDASGHGRRRVVDFPVAAFDWSSDGRLLCVISAYEDPARDDPEVQRGGRPALRAAYIVDLKSREQKRATYFAQSCFAAWAPGGDRLLLSLSDGQNNEMYVTSREGAHTRRLARSQTRDVRPAWSPDGKTVAYIATPAGAASPDQPGVYTIDPENGRRNRLSDMSPYGLSWSRDGKSLLLQAAGGIYITDVQDGKVTKLELPTDNVLDAVYTPDGRGIIFRSNYEGEWSLYTVSLQEGRVKRLTQQLTALMFCLSPLLD